MVTESQVLLFSYTLGSAYMVFGYKVFSVYGQLFAPIYGPKRNLYIRFLSEIWSFRLNGLSGHDVDQISGTQCTRIGKRIILKYDT